MLEAVERRLGIPTPRLEAAGEIDGWGYLLMERLPGRGAGDVWREVASAERERLLAALGEATERIHRLEVPALAAIGPAWDSFLPSRRTGWRAAQRTQGLPERWIEEGGAFLDAIGDALASEPLVAVDADVTWEHLLLVRDGAGWRPSGRIDFADAMLAPVEYELVGPCSHWFPADRRLQGAFLDGYGLPAASRTAATARRFLAAAMVHRFLDLPRAVRGQGRADTPSFGDLPTILYPALDGAGSAA
jgi:hygromycin-B 7''-O-kinase